MKDSIAKRLLPLVAIAAFLAPAGLAQEAPSPLPPLVAQLDLSEGQRKKLTPMYEENARKFKILREDGALSMDERRSRVNEINQATIKTLSEVLTSGQREKLRELRRRQRGQ
ncbi:MAG: hypothetical protein ACKVX9_16935 [Blastocatellia bacterium]